METGKKELTTAQLLEMVRQGDEQRRLARVTTVVKLGPCDVKLILPPQGTLERKLAAIRDDGSKKISGLAEKLAGKSPVEAQKILDERKSQLADIDAETRQQENEAYADYIADIRDPSVSPEGKSLIRLDFLSDAFYLAGGAEFSADTVIEFSREIALLLLRAEPVRKWFISRISNVILYNALRKEEALKNSELSRTGAPVESQPVATAPTGDSSNSSPQAEPSSISTGTTPGESTTSSEGNS